MPRSPAHESTPLASEVQFVSNFNEAIAEEMARGRDYAGFLTALSGRFDDLEDTMRRAEALGSWPDSESLSWGRVTSSRGRENALQINITGPSSEHHFELVVASASEATEIVSTFHCND